MARRRDETKAAKARALIQDGSSVRAAADVLSVHPSTVQRWTSDISRPPGRPKQAGTPDDVVVRLKDQDGLSFEEIARRTGMSKTGVRTRYYAVTGRQRPGRVAANRVYRRP